MEVGDDTEATSHVPRACDRCRTRKIRCNRRIPCSSCTTAGTRCTLTTDAKPRSQHGGRSLLSKKYEDKIDAISSRLDSIQEALRANNSLLERLLSKGETSGQHQATITPMHYSSPAGTAESITPASTSLLAHSREARQALERRLQSMPSISNNFSVINAMQRLSIAVQAKREEDQEVGIDDFGPLPSFQTFHAVAHEARAQHALFFDIWSPFLGTEALFEIVAQLYRSDAASSISHRILGYGAMLYMFVETTQRAADPLRQEQISSFAHNLDLALSMHQTSTQASYDNVLAAIMGATHAVQNQNYEKAWTFNIVASRMCQDLSWHRTASRQSECILFWVVYYLDKCLSLRLGRSSSIQDHDITTELPPISSDHRYRDWSTWFRTTIEIGRLHGLVYDRLYSPGSFSKTVAIRAAAVQEIAAMLVAVSSDSSQPHDDTHRCAYLAYLSKSNEVVIGCLLTLTHRAAPSQPAELTAINPQCLDAARLTIKRHLEAISLASSEEGSTNEYITWTLLNCPFTPFIVLFSNIVLTLDAQDLQLLRHFVDSLLHLNPRRGGQLMNHFRELCQAFYALADGFVTATRGAPNGVAGDEVEGDLSDFDLGPFMPVLPSSLFDSWLSGCQDINWEEAAHL